MRRRYLAQCLAYIVVIAVAVISARFYVGAFPPGLGN